MSTEDVLNKISGDVGYIKGTLDALQDQNDKDHEDIKKRLESGDGKFKELCKLNEDHERRLEAVEGRIQKVEHSQRYIEGLAKFVNEHPRLIIALVFITLALMTGLSVEELKALLEGL